MKHALSVLLSCLIYITGFAQLVARMEIKKHIPGICNEQEVTG